MTETREPTPEEREKWAAQARQADAEARRAEAEAEVALASVALNKAGAEQVQIALERERYKRRKELVDDEFTHVFRFTGPITDSSIAGCIATLESWSRLDPRCDMEIIFQSPGGEIIAGMALFDFLCEIRDRGHRLTTVARGSAASMAAVLLQAGSHRVCGKEAWLLIHEAAFAVIGSYGDVVDTVEWVKRIQERILTIFADRSKLTKNQIKRRWHRKDWWISSDEALKLGLVDEVR